MEFGTTVTTALGFDEAVARTREALAEQGVGILTEIDVQATLMDKLALAVEPYLIMGDRTLVQALDPHVMVSLPGLPALQPVADEAGRRLSAALKMVSEA